MRLNVFEGARRVSLVVAVVWTVGCIGYALSAKPAPWLTYSISWPRQPPVKAASCADVDASRVALAKSSNGTPQEVTLCFTAHRATDGRLLVPYPPDVKDAVLTDGTVVQGVPGGMSKSDLIAKLKRNGIDASPLEASSGRTPKPDEYPEFAEPVRELFVALKEADAKGDATQARKIADLIRALPADDLGRFPMAEPTDNRVSRYADDVARTFSSSRGMADVERSLWDARLEVWKGAGLFLLGGLAIGWGLVACLGWIARGFMGIPRGADIRSDS